MNNQQLLLKTQKHLQTLCTDIHDRSVGSEGNRNATGYFKNELLKHSWNVQETLLNVMDWKTDGATLQCGNICYEVFSSHYALGCDVEAELVAVDTIEKLETTDLSGKIVLLHGEIAKEQIIPKNFVFYNPDEHKRVISALEKSGVKAIISATGRNAALAGGVYPFPMFEDGDFDIPSVFMKDTEGEKLLSACGKTVRLKSDAERIPETAYNIVGSKNGTSGKRVVVTAHIDAKKGTPGAIDNATGVAVLLLLAEFMETYNGRHTVELVALNGEDYYAVPGQMKYLEQNRHDFSDMLLNINIDGLGYKEGKTSFSLFELPTEMEQTVKTIVENGPEMEIGLPWYQGDHSMFLQSGRPAVAVSSSWFIENMETQDVTHTPKDNPSIVDFRKVYEAALTIKNIIEKI